VVADLTREALNQQFDLIVAGEVLEHVDAPGKFMKNCASMLSPEGRLAITVPIHGSALSSQTFVDAWTMSVATARLRSSSLANGMVWALRSSSVSPFVSRRRSARSYFFHCAPS
jgi:2-polyprenyl-3-methyl-5-hydroxy-6-metoxy-1,4-benzoquinol methylase